MAEYEIKVEEIEDEKVEMLSEEEYEIEAEEIENEKVETLSEEEYEIEAEEIEGEKVETLSEEEYEVKAEEVLPFDSSDSGTMNHALLNNREIPNQHPITAIEGLREELDEIKTLKEEFSNQYGHADYYLWEDGGDEDDERIGYFVSVCDGDSTKIKLGAEGEILGVIVDTAGFIGNKVDAVQTKCNTCGLIMNEHKTICANTECQSTDVSYVRQARYGLVATSGIVSVHCESDVKQGDYVMPNSDGIAAKVQNNYGYNVIEISSKYGESCAVIDLGSLKSGAYNLGIAVDEIEKRVSTNEKNIVAAVNTANAAHQQSLENKNISDEAAQKASEALQKADDTANSTTDAIGEISKTTQRAEAVAQQARAIADSAITEATTLGNAAYNRANDAWAIADDIKETAYSLCAKIDKYSVGEYSQAYGLTLEQTQSILKPGFIYVPTSHEAFSGTKSHEESYSYTDEEGNTQKLVRSFTPGYLYQWDLSGGQYGWVTVDKDFDKTSETEGDETSPTNTSTMAVYFSDTEIEIGSGNEYGYWYTNADVVYDISGKTDTYEPYTLYHWEDDHWLAVATLKGNTSNRMVSEIYQTTNEIMATVINPRGGIAGFNAKLTDTDAKVNSIASWPTDDGKHNMAVLEPRADDDGSYMVLAAVTEADDGTSKVTELSGAKIVLSDSDSGSFIKFDADNINFTATADYSVLADNITLKANQLDFGGDGTEKITIDADNINFTGQKLNINVGAANIIGGRNLAHSGVISHTGITVNSTTDNGSKKGWKLTKSSAYDGTKISEDVLISEETYTLSYSFKGVEGVLENIGGHSDNFTFSKIVLDEEQISSLTAYGAGISLGEDGSESRPFNEHNVVLTFTVNAAETTKSEDKNIYIQPNRGQGTAITYELWNIKLERGDKATNWTPAPEDMATSAELKVLSNEISAKVSSQGDSGKGFGWSLDENGFYLKQYTEENTDGENVFEVKEDGDARIGGWEITKNAIEKTDGDGNSLVGMYSGDDENMQYASLIDEKRKAPVRFYAGKGGERSERKQTLTFAPFSAKKKLEQTITLSKEEQVFYKIIAVECPSQKKEFSGGTVEETIEITTGKKATSGISAYYGQSTQTLLPTWVTAEPKMTATDGTDILAYQPSITYLGHGKVLITAYSGEQGKVVNVKVTIVYDTVNETLEPELSFDDTMVSVAFTPQTTGVYSIDVHYTVENNGNFRVLEDGSLYAKNASIQGTIMAEAGNIGAFEITDEGLESDYIKLNATQIYFPKQSQLNLNNKVRIHTATPSGGSETSYITTVNDTDFVIQNNSGAGIRFAKDDTTVTTTVTLTISGPSMSSDATGGVVYRDYYTEGLSGYYKAYWDYTCSLNMFLAYPLDISFKLQCYNQYSCKNVTKTVNCTIPAYTTSASFTFLIDEKSRDNEYIYYPSNDNITTGIGFTDISKVNEISQIIDEYSSKNNSLYSLGHFLPTDDSCALGSESNVWGTLHIRTATQSNSDARLKNSITDIPVEFDDLFDDLKPVSYKFNDGTSGRKHLGFIAQDVKRSLEALDIDTRDFAALCIPADSESYMSIRYMELIALNTLQIQKLKKRVAELEEKLQND